MANTFQTNSLERFPQAIEKAQQIKLLILDVDGVLTDGSLFISADGLEHVKVFDSLDGHGLKMLQSIGLKCAIISGRKSEMVQKRAQSLGLEHIFLGVEKKTLVLHTLLQDLQLTPKQCAAIGDDWPDLGVLKQVGLAACPAQAHDEVKKIAHYICTRNGGQGAVREVCDLILRAQDCYNKLLLESCQ